MSERSQMISKLQASIDARTSYIKAKLGVLVPSQIRALRLQQEMPRQQDLARVSKMHQSRISMFETPGMANMTLETLSRLAAAFEVGLVVKFVSFSEMLRWENGYSQDHFRVTTLDEDSEFLNPVRAHKDLLLQRRAAASEATNAEVGERQTFFTPKPVSGVTRSSFGSDQSIIKLLGGVNR